MLTESSFCGSVFTQPHLQRPALEYEQRNQVLVSLQSKSANVFDSITGAASDSERNISLFAVQKSGQLPRRRIYSCLTRSEFCLRISKTARTSSRVLYT